MTFTEAINKYFPIGWVEGMLKHDIFYVLEALNALKEKNLHKDINEKNYPYVRLIPDKFPLGETYIDSFITIENGEITKVVSADKNE